MNKKIKYFINIKNPLTRIEFFFSLLFIGLIAVLVGYFIKNEFILGILFSLLSLLFLFFTYKRILDIYSFSKIKSIIILLIVFLVILTSNYFSYRFSDMKSKIETELKCELIEKNNNCPKLVNFTKEEFAGISEKRMWSRMLSALVILFLIFTKRKDKKW